MLIFTPFHASEGFPDAKERAATKSFLQKLHIFLPVWKQYIIQEILSRLINRLAVVSSFQTFSHDLTSMSCL